MNRYPLSNAFFVTLGILIFSLPSLAQKGGATTTPRPPSPSPNTNNNNNTLPTTNNRNTDFGSGEMQRPIFLSGKVTLDDGTPPPESVTIELICSGTPRPQGYTGSKGRFSFQLGQHSMVLADASMEGSGSQSMSSQGLGNPAAGVRTSNSLSQGNVGRQSLMGCDLRAVLPAFRSDLVSLNARQSFDNPDVGIIVLHRLGNVQGTTISAVSMQAPKDARKAFEKGIDELKKQKASEAVLQFEKAVALYPKYASAWFELGRLQARTGLAEEAHKSLLQSIAADPKYVSPHLEIALISARQKKWDDALASSSEALRLNPVEFPLAYFLNAVANLNLHHLDAAEKSAREALRLDTQMVNPKTMQVLAVILRDKGDVPAAAEQMRHYIKLNPNAPDIAMARADLMEMEKNSVAAAGPANPN